jgi:hypothetical protein
MKMIYILYEELYISILIIEILYTQTYKAQTHIQTSLTTYIFIISISDTNTEHMKYYTHF